MYISGAKFEEHCFSISRDILYSIFYHFSCKPHDVIIFLIPIHTVARELFITSREAQYRHGKRLRKHCAMCASQSWGIICREQR